MLATLTGDICLLVGLAVLLLPLLATELSRPRDGAWGAVVLMLGLVLITSSDRLRGAPMLGVACAGLLISRLGAEVGQARWHQLSDEERQRLSSRERWATSIQQLKIIFASLVSATTETLKSLKPAAKTGSNKRWVRPEETSTAPDVDRQSSHEDKEDDEDHLVQALVTADRPIESQDAQSTAESSDEKTTNPDRTEQSAVSTVRPESQDEILTTSGSRSTSSNDASKNDDHKSKVSETNTIPTNSSESSTDTETDSTPHNADATRTDED